MNLGMVGLGLLGSALAERFLAAGHGVTGFDLSPARREALAALGGTAAGAPAAVADAPVVVLSLPDSAVVKAVLGGLPLRPGATVLDTTTGDPADSETVGRELAARGVDYLDATVSGSSEQARQGDVVVMAGGPREAFERHRDVLACFARASYHLGGWGAGARMKLVTNLVLGLNRAVLAEGLAFAGACGIDRAEALRVLQASAAYSRAMDAKGPKMVAGDFAPQARLAQHAKDVRLILTEGERVGARLPLSALHRELLDEAIAAGCGEMDNSVIIRVFEG